MIAVQNFDISYRSASWSSSFYCIDTRIISLTLILPRGYAFLFQDAQILLIILLGICAVRAVP